LLLQLSPMILGGGDGNFAGPEVQINGTGSK
jgi:hypothetical protein